MIPTLGYEPLVLTFSSFSYFAFFSFFLSFLFLASAVGEICCFVGIGIVSTMSFVSIFVFGFSFLLSFFLILHISLGGSALSLFSSFPFAFIFFLLFSL